MNYLTETVQGIKKLLPSLGVSLDGPILALQDFDRELNDRCKSRLVSPFVTAHDFNAFYNLMYAVLMHTRAGGHIFRLEPDLIEMLLATDIPRIGMSLLQLPFPSIMLEFSRTPLAIKGSQGVLVYVSHIDHFRIYIGCTDSTGLFTSLRTSDENETATIYDALATTIAQAPQNNHLLDLQIMEALRCASNRRHWTDEPDQFIREYKRLLTLVINAVLYITSPEADIERENITEIKQLHAKLQKMKQGVAREAVEKLLRKAKEKNIRIVGRSIHEKIECKKELSEEARKLVYKHQVRGHWKMVSYGKHGEQKKQQWIQPYWRGPDMAEFFRKNYIVALPKNAKKGEMQ